MKSIIFLDRDGVINEYPGNYNYVTSLDNFKILTGVKEALELLYNAGFELFVVSNQAGVAKGLYTHAVLQKMNDQLHQYLGNKIKFTGIFYCTHLPGENCDCRKPKIGSIKKAEELVVKKYGGWDKQNSFFIGDSLIDVQTARASGVKSILVFSGREKPGNQDAWDVKPDFTADDLLDAVKKHIVKK